MDLDDLRQQILLSNKTASEKAECLLLESTVYDLSKDEWRQLITGIPADVKKEVGKLKSAGTYLHLRTSSPQNCQCQSASHARCLTLAAAFCMARQVLMKHSNPCL